jgi:hypothetical protein
MFKSLNSTNISSFNLSMNSSKASNKNIRGDQIYHVSRHASFRETHRAPIETTII